MPVKARFTLVVGLLITIFVPIAIMALPTSFLRMGCSLLLMAFLPGWGLVEGLFALSGRRPRLGERLILGCGASYVITLVGGLWLYYILGRLTLSSLLALYTAVGLLGFGLALVRRSSGPESKSTSGSQELSAVDIGWLLILLALAAYLRFYYLSYSDFRGDEAEVVLRAVAVIRGDGQPVLSHTKGPAEMLLAAACGLLYGSFDELVVRLPFALANWLAVAGAFLLGYRLFGRRVALLGGALMAINGWSISYGHTAQYQNLVLFASTMAVWCYVQFYQGEVHIYHWLGALFLAMATLGHYEGAAAAPAILYLAILGLKRRDTWGQSLRQNVRVAWPLMAPLLVGAAVALSFYVPFILNPTVAGAQSTLSKRIGGSPPYNNWDAFYINSLSFNSIYYVLGMGIALLGGTLLGIRRVAGYGRRGTLATAGALLLLPLSWTGLLPPGYALLVYLVLMGMFLFSLRVGVFVKTLLFWILLPFGLYLFAVVRPGNHFYVFMPPLVLLAALTLDRGLHRLERLDLPWRRWVLTAAAGGLLVLYGLSTWYEYLVFARTDLEYILTYPKNRQPVFWGDPRFPYDLRIGWGYPYRLGWQTVSELYRSGQLAGDWYGTDENNSIYWYTLGWPRNPCYPSYFMVTEIGYSDPPLKVPQDTIDRYYTLRDVVRVNGQPRLRLYEFSPLGSRSQPVTYYDEPTSYPTLYRQEMLRGHPLRGPVPQPAVTLAPPRRFKPHPDMLARMADVFGDPRIVQVKDEATLVGYDVDDTWAVPGGVLLVTLHWQADHNLIFSYKVFTHVADGDRTLAQADSEPGCGELPTSRWVGGDQIVDRHAIFLPADMPPGDYSLQVGVYEARTDLRMDVLDSAGNPAGNSLQLSGVTIRPKK
jgi:uncharacterized membrane protein